MWNIQITNNFPVSSIYDFAGHQLLEKHIDAIYDSLENRCGEDYKILNNALEQHITAYINTIPERSVELYVYNYGIDNAIVLLNNFNNTFKKYTNTASRSLLFAIFYNRFLIYYISVMDNSIRDTLRPRRTIYAIIKIQRAWRKVLEYRKAVKLGTIDSDFTYLIAKINNEITGEPAKKVLIYLVNKFRKRLSKTLSV